jgi:hypothetical protein
MAVDEKVNEEAIGEENATADLLPCCPPSTKKPCCIRASDRTLPAAIIGCRNFCEHELPPRNVDASTSRSHLAIVFEVAANNDDLQIAPNVSFVMTSKEAKASKELRFKS